MRRASMEAALDDTEMAATATAAIERWLRAETRASSARITRCERLSGGAIQDNWALDAHIEGGPWHGEHAWVLRADARSKVAASLTRAPALVPDPDALVHALGANLARLHAVRPPRAELDALLPPPANPALAAVA